MDCIEPYLKYAKTAKPAIEFGLKLAVQHLAYILYYRQKVDELNNIVKDLRLAKERLDHQRDEAEKNLHNIEGTFIEWFRKVEEFETKVAEFENDEGHTRTQFLFFRNKHRIGKQAQEMAEDAKKIIDKLPKFDEIAYRENVTSNDATLSNAGFVEFGSTKSTMEDIMAQLEDSTVRMVGLYGPGGVGKSTLIKEIAKKARDKKLFHLVVKVEITANPNPQRIQEEIAYVLGLRLEGEGENVRADCLRRRLRKEKENTLIILDDIWDKLDLNQLGIPLDDDKDALMKDFLTKDAVKQVARDDNDAEKSKKKNDKMDLNHGVLKKEKPLGDYKGFKILLTSRNKNVLSDKMEVKSIFCVRKLDDKDALMLFQKVAGIPDEMSNFKQEIIKKYCAGLPMAIVAAGRALRDKSDSVWEATLDKLKNQELVGENPMDISVKMSYDHLENEELKSIFLLCAQMGHQPLIMDLVKYCFGLGILEGVSSLREARDRIQTSIQKLKDSSLMLEESSSYHFKLHDMVRDAALSIAREQNVFALRNGKLDEWSDLKTCTSISICNNNIIDELPNVINCPQLKFFQIDSDDPSLKIPAHFFAKMKKLRVLILRGIRLPSLPPSIKCLTNLRMLCLERCTLDGDLSIIVELKKLRILSFSGAHIENLPDKLGCLDKLQLVDINNCTIKNMIPPNIISKLTCLEELYLRNSLIKMVEEETTQSQIPFLPELKHLHQLKVVDLSIPCAAVLPKDLFLDKLNDYKIVIGDFRTLSVGDFRMPNKYEALKSLALQLKDDNDNIHSQKGIKSLFKRVENLLLGELNGVEDVIYELNLDGFPDLKHLSIIDNTGVKYIINSMDSFHPQDVFPKLESLCLYKLRNIEMICCSPVTDVSFAKLKTIKVEMCANLKNLFSSYMVKFLASLETVDVSECDSLKEIVEIENSYKVEFLRLQSFTIQSLPSLTCFYTKGERPSIHQLAEAQTTTKDRFEDKPPLFGEQVETPNLESLSLSSIKVHKIWSQSSVSFQNLIKLAVKDCCNLRYLCPLSVASGLKKLRGLFISQCPLMEKIFKIEGNSTKVCVFPKLEEILLSKMNMLTDIWQDEVSADSFSSLVSVHIQECKKLNKIFPSHTEGWFSSLDSLRVVDCKSVEVIFEISSQPMDAFGGIDTNLQLILIEDLPNLKHVWSIDPVGILSFKKLRSIEVSSCDKLRNVFRASVAKHAQKLEYISIQNCEQMVEIVSCEGGSATNNDPLVFPELTYMELSSLSNIKHFYKVRHTVECPKLKKLAVYNCKKLKAFRTEASETTNEEEKAVYSAEKVFPNLEFMQIDFDQAQKWFSSNTVKCRMQRLEELSLSSVQSAELLCRFLYRMPNLKKLHLTNSTDLEHLLKESSVPCLGSVLQLKELVLRNSGIKDLGFEQDQVLQRLELLSLDYCHKLIKLAPPSVSLTDLTYLEVKSCRGLKYLMASSTAKSLVQLKTMKVIKCGGVKEIVTNEGNKEDKVMEIVFSKLITIELVALTYLRSFCSHKNLKFRFPSLEILIVRECPMMKTFTESHITAPKLQNILAVEGEEEAIWRWEGDLNATMQKVFTDKATLTYTKDLYLSDFPEFIQQLWDDRHLVQQNNHFRNLKKLRAYGCHSLEHVIPSHLLYCFENLEELVVRNCRAVRVIFNINEIPGVTKGFRTIRLKTMSLQDLPKLEHVWDKDPEGIIGLQVLQEMKVERCSCLRSLFPASVAKYLTKLEALTVIGCKELGEIFSENKKTAEGHQLREEQFLIQIQQACQIPSLKKLTFSIGEYAKVTWDREPAQLQFDNLESFQEDTAPLHIYLDNMLPPIQNLKFRRCWFEKMFSAEIPNADYSRILLHIKGLKLCYISELTNIGLEHSWLQPFPQNLQTLQVKSCNGLKNLVPSTVSFSNLTHLEVSGCESLLYLFTSSTAKSLAQLKRMQIKRCESLEEIVSAEGDESDEDEQIVFKQLQVLYLEELDQLNCFYPGISTLSFPFLEQVFVIDCSLMETFSRVNEVGHSIKWFSANYRTPQEESDLNSAVARRFEEKISEYARNVSDLELRDNPLLPLLQGIWYGALPVADLYFSNLHSLTVVDCQFLSDVLPFNLLRFFTKLETLKVGNCKYVKTIFDVKCPTQDRVMTTMGPAVFSLKNLTLWKLTNLENVWNEDSCEILKMQLFQVEVENCECLTSVFPASVAKDLVKLEKLVVQDCEELVEIVAEDNAHPRGANPELMFPYMTSLTLCDLPKLKYFYNCSLQCDMLKTFTHLQPRAENQACIAKLTPNLEHLTLCENELKMIRRGDFQGNLLHKLKVLTLLNLSSYVFPCGFLLQVPNIEQLEVCRASFKEIFCTQSPNVDDTTLLSHLKVLRFFSLEELISIGLENSWIEPFLKNLETLEVASCSSLKNLVSGTVSFSNLTCLKVKECHSLLYLFTSSTAKSLAQLKTMEIERCKSIEEIVSKEGDESDEDEIIFQQLNCLNLQYLENLTSFYKGSLSFPSMNQLLVTHCYEMKTLCPGTIKADKLFKVELDRSIHTITLENDLNSTMREAFIERILNITRWVSNLKLKDSPDLQEIWHGSLPTPDSCFSYLKCLIVDGCHFLSKVLPFNLLPLFTKLETLEVRNCDSAKTIFDVKSVTEDTILTLPLKKLTLSKLPILENIWNEDPHEILCMQLLQQVYVDNCKCLTSVFPTSVAKNLVRLEDLAVQRCERMIVIVAEDNADQRGTKVELTFPCMTSLTLWDLPKLEYQVCLEKFAPNLKHLTFGENELKMIWDGEFQGNLQHKLKVLTLMNFHFESSNVFAYGFLQLVPHIETLEVCSCSFEEIFRFQSPNVDDTGLLSQLKVITLEINRCSGLRNLAPFSICFPNLTCLFVFECHQLKNLFTSSTAKSLAQLERMEIKSCETIKEIVSMEGDGSHEDEIIFGQLLHLNLESLSNLTSFCKGSLSFPSLVQLSIINCHSMETLCAGTINADKLLQVEFEKDSDDVPLESDLNSTIRKTFLATISESAQSVSYLELRDRPDLQKIWLGSLHIPDLCFSNLHSLIVDGCQFLSHVLPFNLLPFLTKLETLQVRNCDYVKTIFDVKCTTQERIMTSPLKNLTLSKLPNLENVWNENPHEILRMQLLQQVYVDNCKCLTCVFPASVAKDLVKLENLVVQHCEGLMTIVVEDNADLKGTTLELTFPFIVSLTLWDLPKFEYFYNCSLQCDILKTVTHLQQPHTDNQACLQKLTPNLEHLILGENELKVIWHGEFHGNLLHKLKVLILLNHAESNVFAYGCVQQVTNKDKLEVSCYSYKVILCYESPNVDDTEPQTQLKLSLESLPEPFLRNIKFLEVSSCSCLTNLAPSPCFSNMTCLFVFECHQLENLFTESTAKSLAGLKIIEIKSCETIKGIVSMEENGSHEDEIIFGQLLHLKLESLPNLTSFYKGSLRFPSLVQLSVINCHNMENLCAGTINADKLFGVKFENDSDAIPLEIDINSTIRKALHATAFDYLSSSSSDINEDLEYGTSS